MGTGIPAQVNLQKLSIRVEHTGGEPISVLFNPEEYTLSKENNFSSQQVPGLSGPIVQFVSGGGRSLDMKLFFDTYDTPQQKKRDVREEMRKITDLMEIDPSIHVAPILIVSWASLSLRCVLASASQQFVMFMQDGTPVRAWLTVKFTEVINSLQEYAKVKRETSDFHKIHVVAEGETLSGIAGRLYGDPGKWRPIAVASGVADPRKIAVGQELRVPSLPFNDPTTGEAVL